MFVAMLLQCLRLNSVCEDPECVSVSPFCFTFSVTLMFFEI